MWAGFAPVRLLEVFPVGSIKEKNMLRILKQFFSFLLIIW